MSLTLRLAAAAAALAVPAVAALAGPVADLPGAATPATLLGANGPEATEFYNNLPGQGEGVFTSSLRPNRTADDVTLSAAGVKLEGFQFGFSTTAGTTAFTAAVRIFDGTDAGATGSNPLLAGELSSFTVSFDNLNPAGGSFISSPISLTGLPGGGIDVLDGDFIFEIRFLNAAGAEFPNTTSPVTVLFDGTGVNVGASEDLYWRDVDGDGTIDADEGRFFSGPPNLANFALSFTGSPIPEPTSLGLAALAGLGLLRRRRA